jgi:large subunit ribosomal protein L24
MEEIIKTEIKKGDNVLIIAGKDKGKTGKVILVNREKGRVVVEGVNIVIKHKKARSANQKSARETKPGSIDVSNVQVVCAKCDKATRIASAIDAKGEKHRVCKKCGAVLDKKYVKPTKKDKKEEVAEETTEKTETKKPIVRREVKHQAESKIKAPQSKNTKVDAHRKILGGE